MFKITSYVNSDRKLHAPNTGKRRNPTNATSCGERPKYISMDYVPFVIKWFIHASAKIFLFVSYLW